MASDNPIRIDGVTGPQPVDGSRPAATGDSEFRRLLEKLESVARDTHDTKVDGVDDLRDAVRRADDDYSAVMDLRRKLEEAWRNAKP